MKLGLASLVVPEGPESIWVSGALVSTVKVRARRGRVGVAGGVDGPDLEGVGAVGERAVGLRRAAGGPVGGAIGVEAALEARAESSGEEKVKLGLASLVVPEGPESIWVSGALVSTVKVRARRGRVGVAGGVGGPDLEGVGAVGERAVGLRRAAGGPVGGAGVEAALEARPSCRARRRRSSGWRRWWSPRGRSRSGSRGRSSPPCNRPESEQADSLPPASTAVALIVVV